MNINRPLMPGFLKKAEQKLLLNKPGIWSTRVHFIVYYGLLFMIALAAICFLDPSDIRSGSTTEYWIGFVIIISIIGLVVWLIYLLRFNVFKKYGLLHPLFSLTSFILYFISAGIIVLFAYVQPAVESYKANRAYGDEELVKDMNDINTKICQLEYNSLQFHWSHDTVALVTTSGEYVGAGAYADGPVAPVDTVAINRVYPYYRLDSTSFNNRINSTDSLLKINDSLYVLYKAPDYTFVDPYRADLFTKQKIFNAFELYNKVLKYPQPLINRAAITKELDALLDKYNYQEGKQSYYSYDASEGANEQDNIFLRISRKYKLTNIRAGISNIISKKYRWVGENLAISMRVFYYVTLVISLLVFVFRHTTVRTFFLSLLTGVLLAILTAFIMAFMRTGDTGFLQWIIVYTVVFFIGSLMVWVNEKRTAITGIFINLFVIMVPLFPLLLFSYYYARQQRQYWELQKTFIMPDRDLYILGAEVGGALLLLVLLATYIGKLYRRWYSLPED